ncbi:pyrroline-5-carboxylate reductase 2 [Hyalella azteca]|uniref:Pyrroline-5-carboxylate reductase n=1 Tax=Hyalella azteca TaxID=294128 RepID=A0A8B7N4P5_HYAAZ|nr:pyrroline-5-carboxylate reductase 2 [Hyalella azteca]
MGPLRISFIGAGNMAQALAKGLIASGVTQASNITAASPVADLHLLQQMQEMGCKVSHSNTAVTSSSVPLALLERTLGRGRRVVRGMPNTPALLQAGASVYCRGAWATDADAHLTHTLLSSVGDCYEVPEKFMNAVTALSGAGPAYAFLMIEALADGGVREGLPRALAIKLAAKTLLGGARMVLESDSHPGALKDAVCSPGGCTIAGVSALEGAGVRGALINAVTQATLRAQQLADVANTSSKNERRVTQDAVDNIVKVEN